MNGEFTALAAAGGDETATAVGKDTDQEEVSKKDLKKKLHAVLDKTKAGKESVKNDEIQQMARQLLGMIATVDSERAHLRQVGEIYAKLAGENVELLDSGKITQVSPATLGAVACCCLMLLLLVLLLLLRGYDLHFGLF